MRRRAKYGNVKTEYDGMLFDSRKEAHRYGELKLLLCGGVIRDLVLQPTFKLVVGGVLVCSYRADFRYMEDGREIVEDSKGFATPEFKLKKKLFQALYPEIELRIT